MATLPTRTSGYTGIPITTVKPFQFRVIDLNTLIHSVVQSYPPEISKQIDVLRQDMQKLKNFCEVNHIDLSKDQIYTKTVCNVQPSQKIAPWVVP